MLLGLLTNDVSFSQYTIFGFFYPKERRRRRLGRVREESGAE